MDSIYFITRDVSLINTTVLDMGPMKHLRCRLLANNLFYFRNLSSAGLDGRQVMRSCYGLVDSLLFVLRCVQVLTLFSQFDVIITVIC